jgi:hypothetical protein
MQPPAQPADSDILAAIQERVRTECLADANRFGPAFFAQHLEVGVGFALQLANRIGADPAVVEAAGWLHDLAAIRDLAVVPTHAADGARIARGLLSDLGWPAQRVEATCRAIASHSAPADPRQSTPEEVCLSHADVLAQIARPAYWLHYLYGVRGLTFPAGIEWLQGRAQGAWQALIPEAQELGAEGRKVLMALLESALPGERNSAAPLRAAR